MGDSLLSVMFSRWRLEQKSRVDPKLPTMIHYHSRPLHVIWRESVGSQRATPCLRGIVFPLSDHPWCCSVFREDCGGVGVGGDRQCCSLELNWLPDENTFRDRREKHSLQHWWMWAWLGPVQSGLKPLLSIKNQMYIESVCLNSILYC